MSMQSLNDLINLFSIDVSMRAKALASRYGFKEYMVERYYRMFGDWEVVEDLLRSFGGPLHRVVRCNTLKVSDCGYLIRRLGDLGYSLSVIDWCGYAFKVLSSGSVSLGATHEFLVGMYYLHRGPATLLPPIILQPKTSDRVLDLAAGPGGKTTHLSQLMRNEGVVVAVDIDRDRVRALRSNLERLGIFNVVVVRADGRIIPKVFGEDYFDRVLLDAPCTGEGLIQIDSSRRFRTEVADLARAALLQYELLVTSLRCVRSGGYVVYSTCSIAPEEDEFVVNSVINEFEGVEVVDVPRLLNFTPGITEFHRLRFSDELRKCVRVFPHIHGMEGFFICLLRKL
ncbi:MAG: RsmB/NOP family class I SAM-dependent RNA methyltransferase [Sulfolobales archaeon]